MVLQQAHDAVDAFSTQAFTHNLIRHALQRHPVGERILSRQRDVMNREAGRFGCEFTAIFTIRGRGQTNVGRLRR